MLFRSICEPNVISESNRIMHRNCPDLELHLAQLRVTATQFRSMLERTGAACFQHFDEFPRGCCGDTCYLLATHLEATGFGRFIYRVGWRDGCSHAWLEQDGIIVDITADQFADGPGPVIVTNDSDWHRQFINGQESYECRLAATDELMKGYLRMLQEMDWFDRQEWLDQFCSRRSPRP